MLAQVVLSMPCSSFHWLSRRPELLAPWAAALPFVRLGAISQQAALSLGLSPINQQRHDVLGRLVSLALA